MGPSIEQVNPNTQVAQDVQGSIAPFLQQLFANPSQSPLTSDLQRQVSGGVSDYLRQQAPEQQLFQQLQPGLLDTAQNGSDVVNAAEPIFQRNLQFAQGSLANSAPGRFGTTFEGQGIDLTSRALQDFNLFAQQAAQQDVQNQLASAGLLSQLAGQAGQAPFDRLMQAGQLGLGQQNQVLQLLLGGMGFAQPQGLDTVVSDSPFNQFLKLGIAGATAGGVGGFGGG